MNSVMSVVAEEANSLRTVMLTARESDGSVETREIEAYSIRPGAAGKGPLLFGYCYTKRGTRSWRLANLISAEPTGHTFEARWPVEL